MKTKSETTFTISPIEDFDANKSIIGFLVDHPSLGDKGKIFKDRNEAERFVASLAREIAMVEASQIENTVKKFLVKWESIFWNMDSEGVAVIYSYKQENAIADIYRRGSKEDQVFIADSICNLWNEEKSRAALAKAKGE